MTKRRYDLLTLVLVAMLFGAGCTILYLAALPLGT